VDTAPTPEVARRHTPVVSAIGVEYGRPEEQMSVSARDPFEVDPAVVERGLRGHMRAQNALHDYLADIGIRGRSPAPSEPAFDLAWESGDNVWIAEVKSLTRKNEERQLRLGLGQLLRYRQLVSREGREARAVLMAEREPSDPSWDQLCDAPGVVLAWPAVLGERLATV
jgi:hypothetical protein